MDKITENLYRRSFRMPIYYVFVSLLILACGCAHTHYISQHDSLSYNNVNNIARRKKVELTSLNGDSWEGKYIHVEGDSVSWTDPHTNQIKYQLGKLPLPHPPETYLPQQRKKHQIASLDLDEASVSHLTNLPRIHRDPFDRILICQALEQV